MKIYIKTYSVGNSTVFPIYDENISEEEIISAILASWEQFSYVSEERDTWTPEDQKFLGVPPNLYLGLIPKANKSVRLGCEKITSTNPVIEVREFNGWLIIRWRYTQIHGINNPKIDKGWFFCLKDDEDGKFKPVTIPEHYTIGSETGSIIANVKECDLLYPAFQNPWPWPLLGLEKYMGIGKLNALMKVNDSNPLTILLRSPQPYKGLGIQITAELTTIRKLLIAELY